MAINLHDKYAKGLQDKFFRESVIAGLLSNEYSWSGVKTIKVSTLVTVPMGNYTRTGTNRYGTPVEMEDIVQELPLTQDKSFSLTIDKGNNEDQDGIKAAGVALSRQISEQAVPMMDTYVLKNLAEKAGKIVSTATMYTKDNILAAIDAGCLALDDAEVPDTNRSLLVSNAAFQLMKQAGLALSAEGIVRAGFVKGQVGEYSGMKVIKVPGRRLPLGLIFMIVYKNSATAPVKLNDTKIHKDPPGLSGNLLEGRQYYDCFVFGSKADGIYTNVFTGSGGGSLVANPTITAGTGVIATGTGGATIKYTLDGTDPRYSNSALTYTAAITGQVGKTVKTYAFKDGMYPSAVVSAVLS